MEDCCCNGEGHGSAGRCLACQAMGRPVSVITLKHMVKPEFLGMVEKPGFCFCPTAWCEVVYFHSDGNRLEKKDVRVRVGLKESENRVTICYCFGFTEGMVRQEIEATGACTVPAKISAEVRARHCACEVRNPQGSCCLGNVNAVVKRLLRQREQRVIHASEISDG